MSARDRLIAEAAKRILLTDGAWGTQIQTYGLTEEPQSKFQRAIALCRARTENPAE